MASDRRERLNHEWVATPEEWESDPFSVWHDIVCETCEIALSYSLVLSESERTLIETCLGFVRDKGTRDY